MEENVLEKETEVDDTVEYDGDLEEENDVAEEDQDDEFDYDEDGNIVIPDVEFDSEEDELGEDTEEETSEEDTEESEDEAAEEEQQEPESKEEAKTDSKDDAPQAEQKGANPDPKDAEISRLKKELDEILNVSRDVLLAVGSSESDVKKGLVNIAAEGKNVTTDQYLADMQKKAQEKEVKRILENARFEQIAAQDLAELHAAYPETKKYKHLRDMPLEVKQIFGRARDAGLSAKQAYAAANPDGIRTDVATAVKKQSSSDSKSHLKSAVPVNTKGDSVQMSKSELSEWREMFPGMSDSEIKKLYKQSK